MSLSPRSTRPAGSRTALALLAAVFALTSLVPGPLPVVATTTSPSYLFLSPNTDPNLTLAEARGRLAGPAQAHYRQRVGRILADLGTDRVEVHDAIGDWSDGVENSLLVVLPGPTCPDVLRCAAAWFGLEAEQQVVLAFHPDPTGPDVLAMLDLKGWPVGQARRLLDRHGVRDRTILPRGQGCRVVLLDEAGRHARHIDQLARLPGARVARQTGRGEVLVRQRYHEVIRASGLVSRLERSGR